MNEDALTKALSQYSIPIAVGLVSIIVLWAGTSTKKKKPKGTKSIAELPRPPAPPIFGHAQPIIKAGLENVGILIEGWAEQYGPIFALDLPGGKDNVCVSSFDLIKQVLDNRPDVYYRDTKLSEVINSCNFTGIFSAEGERWRKFKRVTSPSLSLPIANAAIPNIQMIAQRLVDKWKPLADTGKGYDVFPDTHRGATDMLSLFVSGHDMDSLNGRAQLADDMVFFLHKMLERRHAFIPLYKLPGYSALFGGEWDKIMNRTNEFLQGIIDSIKAQGASSGNQCMLAQLLHAEAKDSEGSRNALTNQDFIGQAKTMFVAGSDTVSSGLSWFVSDLAQNQEAQDKVRADILKVIGKTGDITPEHLSQLPYLEACMQETLRLHYPGGTMIISTAAKDTVLGGVFIPKGTDVWALARVPALSAKHFTRPKDHWPERWIIAAGDEKNKPPGFVHDPAASQAFGRGARGCPGRLFAFQELKTAMAVILRNFKISLAPGLPPPVEAMAISNTPTAVNVVLESVP